MSVVGVSAPIVTPFASGPRRLVVEPWWRQKSSSTVGDKIGRGGVGGDTAAAAAAVQWSEQRFRTAVWQYLREWEMASTSGTETNNKDLPGTRYTTRYMIQQYRHLVSTGTKNGLMWTHTYSYVRVTIYYLVLGIYCVRVPGVGIQVLGTQVYQIPGTRYWIAAPQVFGSVQCPLYSSLPQT